MQTDISRCGVSMFADIATTVILQDVRVVRKFHLGKLDGGVGRDFSQPKSDKAVIEYEAQSIGLTKVSPGNVRSNSSCFLVA